MLWPKWWQGHRKDISIFTIWYDISLFHFLVMTLLAEVLISNHTVLVTIICYEISLLFHLISHLSPTFCSCFNIVLVKVWKVWASVYLLFLFSWFVISFVFRLIFLTRSDDSWSKVTFLYKVRNFVFYVPKSDK